VKFTTKLLAFLSLIALAGCVTSTPVGNGCEWIAPPPPPVFFAPLEDPKVDGNLISSCTALTKDMGDWLLEIAENGKENCDWKF
jgi:hypothetical protein